LFIEAESLGFALLSMLGWGYGDFYVKSTTRYIPFYQLLRYVQVVGLVPVLVLGIIFRPPLPSSLVTVVLIVAGGLLQFLNVFFSYKSMSVGKASIVSPIASSSAIVSVTLAIAILGERLSIMQIACIVVVLLGILAVASTRARRDDHSLAGVQYALVSAVTGGVYSVMIKLIAQDVGAIGTLVFVRSLVVVILFSLYPFLANGRTRKASLSISTVLVAAVCGFLGFSGRIIGTSIGLVSIVAPVSSASPAVTVMLSQILLKERLDRNQRIGTALVTVGIVLLAAFSV